jgi:hypothetical protein
VIATVSGQGTGLVHRRRIVSPVKWETKPDGSCLLLGDDRTPRCEVIRMKAPEEDPHDWWYRSDAAPGQTFTDLASAKAAAEGSLA